MKIEVLIRNGNTMYSPVVKDDIQIASERKNYPTTLNVSVVKDEKLNIQEGNPITVKVDDTVIFYGFIFTKQRKKDGVISITAYDQLRYLKNKDTYVYENKKANEVISMVASDFNLNIGSLDDTGYIIESRIEDNQSLFDIIQNALDLTITNTGQLFVLYDEAGKLTLKNINSNIVPIIIDEETAENIDYTSTIDGDVYNKIKLYKEDSKTKKREVYIAQSGANMNNWGTLQKTEKIDDNENGMTKANEMLNLYNSKLRTLSINNAFGDVRVKAGCMIYVNLNLGDLNANNLMLVEKCKHKFKNDTHFMDLTVKGGAINA